MPKPCLFFIRLIFKGDLYHSRQTQSKKTVLLYIWIFIMRIVYFWSCDIVIWMLYWVIFLLNIDWFMFTDLFTNVKYYSMSCLTKYVQQVLARETYEDINIPLFLFPEGIFFFTPVTDKIVYTKWTEWLCMNMNLFLYVFLAAKCSLYKPLKE